MLDGQKELEILHIDAVVPCQGGEADDLDIVAYVEDHDVSRATRMVFLACAGILEGTEENLDLLTTLGNAKRVLPGLSVLSSFHHSKRLIYPTLMASKTLDRSVFVRLVADIVSGHDCLLVFSVELRKAHSITIWLLCQPKIVHGYTDTDPLRVLGCKVIKYALTNEKRWSKMKIDLKSLLTDHLYD
ncbi:MAG: hypothetical protein ABII72_04925, partial [Parcubacteria group bacterium]